MRLLWLGGSNDDYGATPEAERGFGIACRMLGEAAGDDVNLVRKRIWPNAALPALVERWMGEAEPEIVYLKANTYWACYESVAARGAERWGNRGEKLVLESQRVLGEERRPDGLLMRVGRRLARRTIGAATYFEPDEVTAMMEQLLRVILRREGVAVVVRGGFPPFAARRGAARARADARYAAMHDGLAQLCARLHVPFLEDERGLTDAELRSLKEPDLTHPNRAGHARIGALDGEALIAAWRVSQASAAPSHQSVR